MGLMFTNYNHVDTPNSTHADCLGGKVSDSFTYRLMRSGNLKATSHHPACVNAMAMDGAVRPVGDGVSIGVWRALSSRNGGEVIAAGGVDFED